MTTDNRHCYQGHDARAVYIIRRENDSGPEMAVCRRHVARLIDYRTVPGQHVWVERL